jgi:hypothetical protein
MGARTAPLTRPLTRALTAALAGIGGGARISAPAAVYDAGDAEITVTATTNFDLSAGRFGAKFTVNGVEIGWKDGVGAVAGAQSLIVSLTDAWPAGLGAAVGDLIGIDPGYSLTDPAVDKVYASDSGRYITASIVTPTITGYSNPPKVGEVGTGVDGTALARIGATRSVLWLGTGVSLGDTDNSYTPVTGDIGKTITFRNTIDGVSATSSATAAVVAGYDAAAQAVIDQWKVTTPALSLGWQAAIDALVVAAKAHGYWTQADGFYVFAADVATNALINWKAPTGTAASAVNAPTFTAKQGYTGDTTGPKYIETNIAANTGGLNFTQDDNATAAYVRLNGTAATAVYAGTSANSHSMTSGNVGSNRNNSANNFAITVNNNNAVVKALVRTGSTAHANYVGSSATAADSGTTTSAALGTETFRFLQSQLRGGSTSQLSLGWFGGSLTGAQIVSMQTDVAAFLSSVSGL